MTARTCDSCGRWTRADQPDESGHETGACELGFRCRPKFGCLEHTPATPPQPSCELPWLDAATAPDHIDGDCLLWGDGEWHAGQRRRGGWHVSTCFSADVTHYVPITKPR